VALYVDDRGSLWEVGSDAEAQRRGLRPATKEDKQRHNDAIDHAAKVKAAEGDNWQTTGEEIQRVGAGALELASKVPGLGSIFDAPSKELLPYEGATEALGDRSNITAGREFSDAAMIRREANPGMAALGDVVATAPLAGLAGAAAGAGAVGLGAGALTATGATIAGESLISGVTTEYTDAWLEKRDMELGNVVRNTAMAAVGDLFLRGLFHAGGKAVSKLRGTTPEVPAPGEGGIFEGNTIGRAAAKARREAKSAGAAAASKKALDADTDALEGLMPQIRDGKFDKTVALVDTYRDDFTRLAADGIADSLEYVSEEGLDTLRKAKYQNWRRGAEDWTKKNLLAQDEGIEAIINQRGDQIIEQIKKAATEVEGIKGRDFKGFEQEIPEYIVRSRRAITAAEGAERNELVDQFKKGLDNYVNRINASRSLSESDQQFLTELLFKDEKIGWNNEVRKFLEDEAAWANNAVIQRDVNQEWHKLINPLNVMRRRIMEITGRTFGERGAAAVERQANYAAIKSLLQRDNLSNVSDYRAWSQALEGIDGIARTYENHGIQIPSNLSTIRESVAKIGDNANRAQLYSVIAKRAENVKKDPSLWTAISSAVNQIPVIGKGAQAVDVGKNIRDYITRRGGAKALKAESPALYDILDKALIDAAKSPNLQNPAISSEYSRTVINWIKQHGRDLGVKIPAGIGAVGAASLFATDADAKEPDAMTLEGAYGQALKDIATSGDGKTSKRAREFIQGDKPKAKNGPLSLFQGKSKSLSEALEDKRNLLDGMDPETLIDGLGRATGQLAQTHPGVYGAVTGQVLKIAAYLQAEMPKVEGKTPLNPKGNAVPLEEQIQYALKWTGATSPEQTFLDIARGRALPQQVAAVKANWGDEYNNFRLYMMGQLELLGERGKVLPTERMRQLDTLLDLDGVATPGLGWKVADSIEAARAAQEQAKQPPPATKAPNLSDHFRSLSQAQADLRMNA